MGKKQPQRQLSNLVYIYLRVSTEGQKKDGKGLDAQLSDCQAVCKRLGLEVLKVCVDGGLSGKLPHAERPGLLEAMEGCAEGLASGIVAYNQDRYARGLSADEQIRMHAIKNGYKLYAGSEEITAEENDISSDLRALFASMERKMIVKRLRGGRTQRAEVDGHGSAPLPPGYCKKIIGYAGVKPITEIAVDEEKAIIVRIILRMVRMEHKSYQQTANYLNEKGYPTPFTGKIRKNGMPFSGQWTKGQIQKIMEKEELYTTGRKTWNGIDGEARWPVLFNY